MDQNNKKLIVLNEVESTNNYANQLILSEAAEEGTVVLAHCQTHGKGQQGNKWESAPGKNLLMSLILYPGFLPASHQFLISKVVSLAISGLLNTKLNNCRIKWPNDIYVEHKKMGGILIENSVKGPNLYSSVVGIGLNINQDQFFSDAPNPVSLKQITGKSHDISVLLEELMERIDFWYDKLKSQKIEEINETYFSKLYRSNEWGWYQEPGNQPFEAQITGIGKYGQLQLQLRDKSIREYMFKEVEFI